MQALVQLTFTSAPPANSASEVRHIGFAGSAIGSSGGVTAFYEATGNVALRNTDDVVVRNINSAGVITLQHHFLADLLK